MYVTNDGAYRYLLCFGEPGEHRPRRSDPVAMGNGHQADYVLWQTCSKLLCGSSCVAMTISAVGTLYIHDYFQRKSNMKYMEAGR